jgi:hypothetical protein
VPHLADRRILLLVWGVCLAVPAAAQTPGHALPRPGRPLHARLAQADVVALGTIERVELGRIQVGDAVALRGAPGERFAVKRAPSRAPDLSAGDRTLLLLRGARTPYVQVDEPSEVMLVADPAGEARWRDALAELLTASGDEAVRDVYLEWIDGSDDELRDAATGALADRRHQPPLPIGPDVARARARIALDPRRPVSVRRASASIAVTDADGVRALLAGTGAPGVDPGVVQLALAMGALRKIDGLEGSVLAALRSPDRGVRKAALPAAATVAGTPAVHAELQRLAAGSDDELARAARRALGVADR